MRRSLVFASVMLLIAVGGAAPAMAHSDQGLLALETAPADAPLGVEVRARLVYANDRDPVSSATVTVEGTGPNGVTVAPQPLSSQGDGEYRAVVVVPVGGPWTFRATAAKPEASAETTVTIQRRSPSTTAGAATSTSTAPTTTTLEPVRTNAPVDDDGGGGAWLLAAAAIALIAAVTGGAMWLRARRRATA